MPDPDLICEVRTEGGTYRDWLSVAVSYSLDTNWMRTFSLTCAEPSAVGKLRLKPGDRVDIALAGKVVIRNGRIKVRQAAYDANRHAVRVDGFSAAGAMMDVSARAGTGQFRGYKLDAIARAVLKPLGLGFRIEEGPDGHDTPFPNVRIRHGESPFALLSRLATQRGLWLHADADGTVVAGAAGGSGSTFTEGDNILSANCQIVYSGAEGLVFSSQQPGSDTLFGSKASEISAKAPLPGGDYGLPIVGLNEMPASQKETQLRTNMEAQKIAESLFNVSLTYRGWLKPDGELWQIKDPVVVKSPMLFPTESGQEDLKMWGVTYTQSEAGTTTTLDLRNKLAFGQRNADANDDGNFFQVPGLAQPQGAV